MEQDERGVEEIAELRGVFNRCRKRGRESYFSHAVFPKNEISLIFFKITEFLILVEPFLYLEPLALD